MGLVLSFINILFLLIIRLSFLADAGNIGLNYALFGNNLPSPPQVISLVKSRNIQQIRLLDPNHDALDALKDSSIQVILGITDDNIPFLANNNDDFAKEWVRENIAPYASAIKFRCISIGNGVEGVNLQVYLFAAIRNLHEALKSSGYQIPVTTTIGDYLLRDLNPPSSGDFSAEVKPAMQDILSFLSSNGYPLLVLMYPYLTYVRHPSKMPLSYALGNSTEVFVRDGNLEYKILFDAMTDALYSALEKVSEGSKSLEIVICETGWPSKGDWDFESIELAQTYNQNLVKHVLSNGTPKKPGKKLETYIFSIFTANHKPGDSDEQDFGLYYPNMTEVYHIDF